MNAKKAKMLRKMARELTAQAEKTDDSNMPAQVVDSNGAVINTASTVRGAYQYLKAPRDFMRRYKKRSQD